MTNNDHHNSKKNRKSLPRRTTGVSVSNMRAVSQPGAPMPPAHQLTAVEQAELEVKTAQEKLEATRAAARAAAEAEAKAERRAVTAAAPIDPRLQAFIDDQVEAQLAVRMAEMFPVRLDLVPEDQDDLGVSETYEGADMQRRLDAIMDLVDKLGAITSGDVTAHIRGKDGRPWQGTPVRNQLQKLFRQRKLVMRGYFPPKGTTVGNTGKARTVYARTEAQLDAYITAQNAAARKKRN